MDSTLYTILLVAAASIATILTRVIPFLIFNERRPMPDTIKKIADSLPPAIIAVLVIYCLKGYVAVINYESLAALIAVVAVVLIHLWKKNVLLSIALGTAIYMVIIRIL